MRAVAGGTEGLLARKAYQIVEGADNKGIPGKDPNGAVVASYAILSQFDIKRDYNPQTGEELNVIVENTTDRPRPPLATAVASRREYVHGAPLSRSRDAGRAGHGR
jgi:hypothetical protein